MTALEQLQLVNITQAAAIIEVTTETLRKWRIAGKGPRFIQYGGLVKYDRSEIERWQREGDAR